jgi:DNA mismatch repair protein MutS2
MAAGMSDLRHLHELISDAFDAHGQLADHASEALGPLRRKLVQLQGQLERRMRTLVDDGRISPHLQDRYYTSRDDRYVVPVRVEARSQIRGIVHGTSQSGQTVFVEPEEIVELGNRVKLAECDVKDEEQRILAQLTTHVREAAPALRAGLDAATELDCIAACAELADALGATAPRIARERALHLGQARHPLMVLSGRPCVPNDIAVEPGTILIISGPNAGGKTVALKTAGLASLMTRAGLHIPADPGSSVPWFTDVHSDIGDSQSLENDLSTFSAHLVKLRQFLDDADQHTLLLIDEISVGTEPEQGAALAQAVLETLAEHRAAAIVTTHYERLKALGAGDPRFGNASVGFDLDTMEPTFELHLGVPGSSGALAVARRMGLPAPVVDRAESLMGERRTSIEELLAEVADERRRLAEERAELARTRQAEELARKQAEVARDAAREYERKLKQGAYTEAVAALRRARDELDQVRSAVKRRDKPAGLSEAKARISALSSAISEHAPARPAPEGTRATEATVRPGTVVYVTSLGSRGTVVEPAQRGKVTVQVGTMKTAVPLEVLVIERGGFRAAAPPAEDRSRRGHGERTASTTQMVQADHEGRAGVRTPDATIDVRGERVEEAVDAVDRFIDDSLRSERDMMFVIHGHGTGALRSAIRSHLGAHPAVTNWRAGERSEGGDGVTVAWLDNQ